MRLGDRIRMADPLAGRLPGALAPPELSGARVAPASDVTRGGRRLRRPAAVVLVAAACAAVVVSALVTRSATDGQSVVRTFAASTPAGGRPSLAAIARSVRIVRERLASFDVVGAHVAVRASSRISVSCSGCGPSGAAALQRATQPAQLLIYDWEPNVLAANCRPRPAAADVTGGAAAGYGGALTYYDAVLRATRCPARRYAHMSHAWPAYYAVDPARRRVLSGPETSAAAARAAVRTAHVTVVRVRPGTTVLEAPGPAHGDGWFVLRDDAALTGRNVVDPKSEVDAASGSRAAAVTFRFTRPGQHAFESLTRRVASRGRAAPASASGPPFQHFAIALDDHLLAVPFVDFRSSPHGLDGRRGAKIEGGLTPASARQLAGLLRSGSLPLRLAPTGPTPAPTGT